MLHIHLIGIEVASEFVHTVGRAHIALGGQNHWRFETAVRQVGTLVEVPFFRIFVINGLLNVQLVGCFEPIGRINGFEKHIWQFIQALLQRTKLCFYRKGRQEQQEKEK